MDKTNDLVEAYDDNVKAMLWAWFAHAALSGMNACSENYDGKQCCKEAEHQADRMVKNFEERFVKKEQK